MILLMIKFQIIKRIYRFIKKTFGISYKEYNLLKECKNKYDFSSEFVNEKNIK